MSLNDEDLKEIITDFLVEANDLLEQMDQDLIALESSREDFDLLNRVFRNLHTVKGTANFLAEDPSFFKIGQIAHTAEDVMDLVRNKELALSPELMDQILAVVDMIKLLFQDVEEGAQSQVDPSDLIAKLKTFLEKDQKDLHEDNTPEVEISPKSTSPLHGLDDDDLQEIIQDFLVESSELLEQIDQDLIALEGEPENSALLHNIFRCLHTIKGTANFLKHDLNFAKMASIGHSLEDIIGEVREEKLVLTRELTDTVLQGVDLIKKLHQDAQEGIVSSLSAEEFLAVLETFLKAPSVSPTSPNLEEKNSKRLSSPPKKIEEEGSKAVHLNQRVRAEPTIRVETTRLNSLMNLAGELVLGRNRLLQVVRSIQDSLSEDKGSNNSSRLQVAMQELTAATDFLDFVTSDLQMAVLKTRMQPIGKIFNRFSRTVRDLARDLGKEVQLVIQGAETELDKSVIDEIGDPLTHLLRNAIDHGVESGDIREKNGKARRGTVQLSALQEGNYILIRLSDDGKGIDPEVIKEKAIKMKMINSMDAQRLPKKEILSLIFAPGFSTAGEITSVSGRGVGMDVVKNNIEKLNGSVEIFSELGEGTTFTIRLPLTLAIIPSLQVKLGKESFAIPLASVVETVRIYPHQVETVSGHEVIRFRKKLIPLLRLERLFELPSSANKTSRRLYIVVVGVAEKKVGLVIDKLVGQEEIVVKPLGNYLEGTPGITGACIAGDGRVILILDVVGLLRLLPKSARGLPSELESRRENQKEKSDSKRRKTILIAEDARGERKRTRLLLESKGYKVIESIDGKDAFIKLMENQIDLVITDIEMPGLDGYKLTEKIRKTPKYRNIPVIAISARKEMINRIKGMESGIDTYLPKPFPEQELFNALKNLLS